jgi:Flp pilus assembly pilin Flp
MIRRELFYSESGSTAVEYAVVLGLLVAVMLSTIKTVGSASTATFEKIAKSLEPSPDAPIALPGSAAPPIFIK